MISFLIALWLILGVIAYIRFLVFACNEFPLMTDREFGRVLLSSVLIILCGVVSFIAFVVVGGIYDKS